MWRHLPNALSITRIAAAPVLVALAATGHAALFTWVLVPALLTDMADGLVARLFHLESQLGAMLDSVGDMLLMLAALYGIWAFHPYVLTEHSLACGLLVGAWLVEATVALLRYGRLSSFHTYLCKIAGNLLGFFVGVLFIFGFQAWMLHLAVAVSVAGSIEELALLALLPRWRADVRGIWWVLRERNRL
jgi:phosphatidylglycerophosphate synthase